MLTPGARIHVPLGGIPPLPTPPRLPPMSAIALIALAGVFTGAGAILFGTGVAMALCHPPKPTPVTITAPSQLVPGLRAWPYDDEE